MSAARKCTAWGAAAVMAAGLVTVQTPAYAAGTAEITSLSPDQPWPGATLVVSGTGCDPSETVHGMLWLTAGGAAPVEVIGAAAEDGSFSLTAEVPTEYPVHEESGTTGEMGIRAVCGPIEGIWDYTYRFLAAPPVEPPASTTTTVKVKPKKVHQGKRAKVVVRVRSEGTPVGALRVKVRGKAARLVPLRSSDSGRRLIRLPKLKVGRYKVKVRFVGGEGFSNSRGKFVFRVVRRG